METDYKQIGALTVDIYYDYSRATDKRKEMLDEEFNLDEIIKKLELNAEANKEELKNLYADYRELKQGLISNEVYISSLFTKLMDETEKLI